MKIPSGWKKKSLQDVLSLEPQNGYSPNCVDYTTNRVVLGLGNLTESGISLESVKNIPDEDAKVNTFKLQTGDFLISRSNTPDKVGRVAVFTGAIENCYYPDLMMRFRVDEKQADIGYVEKFLTSTKIKRYYQKCSAGSSSTMVKINKETVNSTPILLPPLPEQKAIADLLSTWDSAIEKTERLIAAKEQNLKQKSRSLLFGHKRIDGKASILSDGHFFEYASDWNHISIKKIAKEVVLRNTTDDVTVLSCSKYDGFVNSLDYFGKKVFSDDTSNYKVVKKWQFGYPANHIEEGSIGLLDHCDQGIVSPIYVVFEVDQKRVYPPFLYRLFKTNVFKHIFQVNTSSSVDRRGSLRWTEFASIKVVLPELSEQKIIAETLDGSQREINVLKAILAKYKEQKRGLMQKLLTGEWRVKVGE